MKKDEEKNSFASLNFVFLYSHPLRCASTFQRVHIDVDKCSRVNVNSTRVEYESISRR